MGVIGFSLYYYLRQRSEVRSLFDRSGARFWWTRFWSWLKARFFAARQRVVRAVEASLARIRTGEKAGTGDRIGGAMRIGRLPPRERVRQIYLAMLRRAEENGFRRKPTQTPAEFARVLDQALPEQQPEIQSLTDSFIEARYSLHEITPDDASFVMRCWARVRAALSQRSTPGQS